MQILLTKNYKYFILLHLFPILILDLSLVPPKLFHILAYMENDDFVRHNGMKNEESCSKQQAVSPRPCLMSQYHLPHSLLLPSAPELRGPASETETSLRLTSCEILLVQRIKNEEQDKGTFFHLPFNNPAFLSNILQCFSS